mgnify:CR=1 FL=1
MENGKKVCRELKAVRQQIADANDIEYTPNECTHKGDCPGSCPACESEVRYLERQLNLRRSLGKAVVLAGLSLSVTSCAPGCTRTVGAVERDNVCDSVVTDGEVFIEDSFASEQRELVLDLGYDSSEVVMEGDVLAEPLGDEEE